eukprot:scaffold340_cov256-Pinguiococcus_pyrenoidosus.AAC.37
MHHVFQSAAHDRSYVRWLELMHRRARCWASAFWADASCANAFWGNASWVSASWVVHFCAGREDEAGLVLEGLGKMVKWRAAKLIF